MPSIGIYDKKEETQYFGKYTEDAELLNYGGCGLNFIRVIKIDNDSTLESLYYADKRLLAQKMTIPVDDYEMSFFLENPNSIRIFITENPLFKIELTKHIAYENKDVNQKLITKISQNRLKNGINGTLEQKYTYGNYNVIERKNNQDNYLYNIYDNLIYGINNCNRDKICDSISGVLIEKLDENIDHYLPYKIQEAKLPMLENLDNLSVIVFTGFTNVSNRIQICKTKDRIYVNYEIREIRSDKKDNDMFSIPNLEDGYITSKEISKLVKELNERYNNNFTNVISEELLAFADKLDEKHGKKEQKKEVLSPLELMNKDFDDIKKMILEDKQGYFEALYDEFKTLTKNFDKGSAYKPKNNGPQED